MTLTVGATETITVTISPANATNKKVNWATSNADVATVDANGKVTAMAAGTAIITATSTADSSKNATCVVDVVPLTIDRIEVVDGADGVTLINIPEAGQVIRANIILSDGTPIYTYPVDERVTYTWYYKESSDTILGTEGSYTVTSDNVGKTICVKVTVTGIGEATWEAGGVVPLTIGEIDGVGINLRKGSIIMSYTFTSGGEVITYKEAISDTYALDTEASTVTLLKDGSPISPPVKLNKLEFADPDPDSGESAKVVFESFSELLDTFDLPYSEDYIPTHVKVNVQPKKTSIDGIPIANPWEPIESVGEVAPDLILAAGINADNSTATVNGPVYVGTPFEVDITIKDGLNNFLPDGNYTVEILANGTPIGPVDNDFGDANPIYFEGGSATVYAVLSAPGIYTLTVKVNGIEIAYTV